MHDPSTLLGFHDPFLSSEHPLRYERYTRCSGIISSQSINEGGKGNILIYNKIITGGSELMTNNTHHLDVNKTITSGGEENNIKVFQCKRDLHLSKKKKEVKRKEGNRKQVVDGFRKRLESKANFTRRSISQ